MFYLALELGLEGMMRRREFIARAAAATIVAPLPATAQQRRRPVIGYLGAGTRSSWLSWTTAFSGRLAQLGWIEGKTVETIYRWGDGNEHRFREVTAEFVSKNVDIIVTGGGAVGIARQATEKIPIVFALANDPVGAGYVASLARPGGNVTGNALQALDLVGKRLELLREIAPRARRLGILANVGNRGAAQEMQQVIDLAPLQRFEPVPLEIRTSADIWRALDAREKRVDAIIICRDALLNSHDVRIAEVTAYRLPTIHNSRGTLQKGALIFYGPHVESLFQRAAEMVDKILRGARPADIPVEQPTRFNLGINLKTAKALGIEVPPMLLARADEVIE